MNKALSILGIIVAALVIVGVVMGGLVFLLIWLPAQGETQKVEVACPEGQGSFICMVRGYMYPKEPEGI